MISDFNSKINDNSIEVFTQFYHLPLMAVRISNIIDYKRGESIENKI